MGGKHKQSQRTKGNVKPSSSARAAELLVCGSQSTSTLGFVGFQGLSDGLGYVPAVPGTDDVDNSVDHDFRIVLRKLSKKDGTTKLKALQEFSALCQKRDDEAVKTVLPFWPRLYNKVSIDHDRRVREAAQQAFEQLVLCVHKNLAPHLKSLMGSWFVAQADTYAPAAMAARTAFQVAFPANKQVEALVFCKDEILSHLHDNLIVHTIQTLSDIKMTEVEDMEAKYNRVVCASLNSLRNFLQVIPQEQQQSLVNKYRLILNENKFWKYAKHPQAMIQGSFYAVLAAFCHYQPELAKEFSAKISPVVLHNLGNTEPLVCGALWDAVLYTTSTLKDCWTHVNLTKGVLPGLWTLLSSGASGSAVVIYHSLLPFISQLTSNLQIDKIHFYKSFFENMKSGMTDSKVLLSKSELDVIVRTFVECLQYTVNQNLTDCSFINFILREELVPLLTSAILQNSLSTSTLSLFSVTVDFFLYLYKSSMDDDPVKASIASDAISSVLDSLKSLRILEHGDEKCLGRYAAFLCIFRHRQCSPISKTVRFSASEQTAAEITPVKTELVFPPILDLVYDSCRTAYEQRLSRKSVAVLEFFADVSRVFAMDHIFDVVWASSTTSILCDVIRPWMIEYSDVSTEERVSKAFIDIIAVLFIQCPSCDKKTFLTKAVDSIPDVSVCLQFLEVVSKDLSDENVCSFFRGEQFGFKMADTARIVCQQSTASNDEVVDSQMPELQRQLLKLAFISDSRSEPLLDARFLSMILDEVTDVLTTLDKMQSVSETEAFHQLSFVCDLTLNLFSKVKGSLLPPKAKKLLMSLFQLSCKEQYTNSGNCFDKLRKTWQQGIITLMPKKSHVTGDNDLIDEAAEYLRNRLLKEGCTFNRLPTLVSITLLLADCISSQSEDTSTYSLLTNKTVLKYLSQMYLPVIHTDTPEWHNYVVVTHELTLDSLSQTSHDDDLCPSKSLPTSLLPAAYTAQLFHAITKDHLSARLPLNTEIICSHSVCDMIYAYVLSDILLSSQKQGLVNTDLSRVHQLFEETLSELVNNFTEPALKEITGDLLMKSLCQGKVWSLSLKVLLQHAAVTKTDIDLIDLAGGIDVFNELSEEKLHTLEVVLPYLQYSIISHLTDIQSAQILTFTTDKITTIPGCRSSLAVLCRIIENQDVFFASELNTESVEELTPVQTLVLILDHIQTLRQEHDELFLFDSFINDQPWSDVSFNIEVMRFMQVLIEKYSSQLTAPTWDFILCSLMSWIQSCYESKQFLASEIKARTFSMASFHLLYKVAHCLSVILPKHPDGYPDNLLTEWNEFFSEGIYNLMLPLFVQITGEIHDVAPVSTHQILSSLSSAVSLCPASHIKTNSLPVKLVAGDDGCLPDSYQSTLNHFCPLLLHPSRAVQLTAYKLLLSLMPQLSEYDDKQDQSSEDEKPSRSPPAALMTSLFTCNKGLDIILSNVSLQEDYEVNIDDAEYVITMGYLLSWNLLLTFFKEAKVELRAQYAQFLRDEGLLESLLDVLFKLMPENPVIHLNDALTSSNLKNKLTNTTNMFETNPSLIISEPRQTVDIHHMACAVYFHTLQDLPALMRHWFNSVDKKIATIADKYTTKYVSSILCNLEIKAVQEADVKIENMMITTRPAAREVVATYTVEELTMELVVTLPKNHPLGQITVECGKRIGVAAAQWRNWMLQLTTFLHRQNGSILDGLTLWRRNVNKRFEGIEECMICFSVIHGSNCQLPKLKCKTCKKRFHSACLYKWFNTSNNSSCPLCRNLF